MVVLRMSYYIIIKLYRLILISVKSLGHFDNLIYKYKYFVVKKLEYRIS